MSHKIYHWTILFLVGMLCHLTSNAQSYKQFTDFDAVLGQYVGIYNLTEYINNIDNIYYKTDKGKFKKYKLKENNFNHLNAPNIVFIEGFEFNNGKQYLTIKDSNGLKYYILMDQFSEYELLPLIAPYATLKSTLEGYNLNRAYILSPYFNPNYDEYHHKYLPVRWKDVKLGDTFDKPETYIVSIGDEDFVDTMDGFLKKYKFVDRSVYDKDIENEKKDSLADFTPYACYINGQEEGLPERAFAYLAFSNNDSVYVYHNYTRKGFKKHNLQFENDKDYNFLKTRGWRGSNTRRRVAISNDSIESGIFFRNKAIQDSIDRAEALRMQRELDEFIGNLRDKKIFILDENFAFSDYGPFGKTIQIYNCFAKNIKYINITFTAYNMVEDVQRDNLGRSTASARCIGPIEPGEIADYTFEELFWDDNDLIQYIWPTNITIEFNDGTKTTYNTRKTIDLHRISKLIK